MVKEALSGTHLIYADEVGACRGLLEGSSRYAEFSHELLGEEGTLHSGAVDGDSLPELLFSVPKASLIEG